MLGLKKWIRVPKWPIPAGYKATDAVTASRGINFGNSDFLPESKNELPQVPQDDRYRLMLPGRYRQHSAPSRNSR